MKKILYFVQLPPPIHGVSVCNKNIIDSCIVNTEFESRVIPIQFNNSISDMQKTGITKLLKAIPISLKLLKNLIFFKPDIVYISLSPIGAAFIRDVLFVTIIKLFSCKIVYHLHGKGIANVTSPLLKCIYRYVFNNTSIICLSALLTKDIMEVKGNATIHTCANGVEVPLIPYQTKKDNSQSVSLLFLSNLLPLKGIKLYLETAVRLLNEGIDIEVNIAGPFTDKYSEIDFNNFLSTHKVYKNNIKYHGSVTGIEKWKLLKETDILVHPTYNDAFPLVLLEAMASGCLIVSTKQGGIPDILNNKSFGFIIEEISNKALHEKLSFVLRKQHCFQVLKNDAIREFKEKYTKECFELRVRSILENTLKN